jgi:hypothetical protein
LAIELIDVSFDRMAAIVALDELKRLFPSREWRLIHVDVVPTERQACESRVRQLIQRADTHMGLNIGTAFWFAGESVLESYVDNILTFVRLFVFV